MPQCPTCGKQLEPNVRFCPDDGTPLTDTAATQTHTPIERRPVTRELELPDWACHLPLKGDDATPISNDLVNLTPYIREDILLALPQHPLCEPECRGLKLPASVDPGEKSDKASSAWSELDKLKL